MGFRRWASARGSAGVRKLHILCLRGGGGPRWCGLRSWFRCLREWGLRGNLVRIRGCPAAVSGDETRATHWARAWEAAASRLSHEPEDLPLWPRERGVRFDVARNDSHRQSMLPACPHRRRAFAARFEEHDEHHNPSHQARRVPGPLRRRRGGGIHLRRRPRPGGRGDPRHPAAIRGRDHAVRPHHHRPARRGHHPGGARQRQRRPRLRHHRGPPAGEAALQTDLR